MGEKGGKSLNKEIVDRLRGSIAQGETDSLAAALRPILDKLDADERQELVAIAIRAFEILATSKTRRRR